MSKLYLIDYKINTSVQLHYYNYAHYILQKNNCKIEYLRWCANIYANKFSH